MHRGSMHTDSQSVFPAEETDSREKRHPPGDRFSLDDGPASVQRKQLIQDYLE